MTAILSEHLASAVTQVNFLEDIASRTGLRTSAEKTNFSQTLNRAKIPGNRLVE